jgi:hypothetical protein
MTERLSANSNSERNAGAPATQHPYRDAPNTIAPLTPEVGEVPIRAWTEGAPLVIFGGMALLGAFISLSQPAFGLGVMVMCGGAIALQARDAAAGKERRPRDAFPRATPPERLLQVGAIVATPGGWIVRWLWWGRPRVVPFVVPVDRIIVSSWCFVAEADLDRLTAMRFALERLAVTRSSDVQLPSPDPPIVEDVSGSVMPQRHGEISADTAYVAILTAHEMWLIADSAHAWRTALGSADAPAFAEARVLVNVLRHLVPSEFVARVGRSLQGGASFRIPRDLACSRLSRNGSTWSLDLSEIPGAGTMRQLRLRPSPNEERAFDRWRAGLPQS